MADRVPSNREDHQHPIARLLRGSRTFDLVPQKLRGATITSQPAEDRNSEF
jgi:hypothetical protein